MKRREFIAFLGGAAAARPCAAYTQQAANPLVGFVNGATAEASARNLAGFRKGLAEAGYIEGQNVTVEYHWLDGQYDRLPAVMTDLVQHRAAVIATPASDVATFAAKAATTTIPIVFGVAEDPVRLGLVASLAKPGGNVTGVNFFFSEVIAKRLRLLHDLVPNAAHIAVLVNPGNPRTAEATIEGVEKAAPSLGLQAGMVLHAATIGEIDTAFAGFAHDRPDALFVAPDGFFFSRAVQFATLAARERMPASYSNRDIVAAGGLMSYGPDLADVFRQVGLYTGRILKGEKPAELPVLQSSKFELVINLQTARTLGIDVPSGVLSIADEAIE